MTDEEEPISEDLADPDVADPMQGQVFGEETDLQYRDLEEVDAPGIDVEEAPEADEAAKKRTGFLGWVGRIFLTLLVILLGLAGLAALLYNFGTMEAPSAEVQGQYDQLVATGQALPTIASPGFRIPIPGCKCHAADPDIGNKQPGRTPDVSLVMAHRYRTISQCGQCHGGNEPKGVEGQPLEDAPAQ
jgi:hypothetical protein